MVVVAASTRARLVGRANPEQKSCLLSFVLTGARGLWHVTLLMLTVVLLMVTFLPNPRPIQKKIHRYI